MNFIEIPNTIKAAIAVGLLAIGGYKFHDQFITEVEASQSARIDWINDVAAELRTLKRLLRSETNPEQRQWLEEDIEDLEKKLKCLKESDNETVQYC